MSGEKIFQYDDDGGGCGDDDDDYDDDDDGDDKDAGVSNLDKHLISNSKA